MNAYLYGLLFGIAFALLAFVFARKRRRSNADKFDERQMLGRGKAFRAGFFTLLTAGAVCNAWDFIAPLPGGSFLWNIGVLLLGVTVFAVTAIHFDAYVGMYDNPRRFLTMGACFIFAMAAIGLTNLHSDSPQGPTMGILNFGVGIVWIVIVAALLLHRRSTAEKEEE